MILHELQNMNGREIPMAILTDSEIHFNNIIRSSVTTEKRLMIYLKAAREAYKCGDTNDVGWSTSAGNLANGMATMK